MASLGLSELARYGFVDLEATVSKLDSLVGKIGDAGRAALADLGLSANPDQALNALLELADIDKVRLKKILNKPELSSRLIRTLGASSAMVDLLRRKPAILAVFEDKQNKPASTQEILSRFRAAVDSAVEDTFDSRVSALRRAYRTELIRLVAFDVTAADPIEVFPEVSRNLSDLATSAIEIGLEIARWELVASDAHGNYSKQEVEATGLAVMAMGKCGARELNYLSDVDVIYVAEALTSDVTAERALEIATKLATRMMRAMDGSGAEPALWQV
ncbi:MAG: hypothetical protein RL140_196, partial [Actinomycetota bacterium]